MRSTQHCALLTASVIAFSACNAEEELGVACGVDAPILSGEIVEGEVAVDEVVRIQRDGVCGSFQCLTEGGLAPYCTEPCEIESGSSKISCEEDAACTRSEEHCIEGQCVADDCPAGFTCEHIQDTGPLAPNRYCVRQTGCLTNFDCGDVGKMRCEILVCLDACLLIGGGDECTTHYLTCQPREDVPYCLCTGEAQASNATYCEPDALTCDPPEGDEFPVGAAVLRGTCVGIEQTVNKPVTAN